MKIADVDFFEKVRSQMTQLQVEMSILAKGKANDPINKFKLMVVNERLRDANTILSDSFKPITGFDEFNETDMPTSSDAVIVLSQYLDALEGWRCANIKQNSHDLGWYWDIDDKQKVRTTSPKVFRIIP